MENNDKFKEREEQNEPIVPAGENSPTKERKEVVYYDAYDHGFTNGILKIPREYFEQFIDYSAKRNLAQKELGLILNDLNGQKVLLAASREKLLQLNNMVAQSEHEMELIQDKQRQEKAQLEETQTIKGTLAHKIENVKIEYNWFNVSLFIFIGFVFIISDFFITYDVLSNGLNLENYIALILAAAVSSITFVIKPTIDRIFEKPNLDGKKFRQHALLITVSILAIIALGCLGYFREEYFAQKQKTEVIKGQLRQLDTEKDNIQTESANCARRNNIECVTQKNQELAALNQKKGQLSDSIQKIDQETKSQKILYFIFVICNMLFGVAGAICLSIAFPVFDRLLLKIRLNKTINKVDAKENLIYDALSKLQNQYKNSKDAKSQAQNSIELLPDLKHIENKIDNLQQSANTLLKLAAENDAAAETALYGEAYERGSICEFNDKIIFSLHQMSTLMSGKKNGQSTSGSEYDERQPNKKSSKDDRYLHQQIRSVIDYNHQNKKHLLNGENT